MRILALDYGETYLGVALGEGNIATQLSPINNRNWNSSMSDLAKIIAESGVRKIVLGQVNPPSPKINKFAAFLERRFKLPIILVKEDFSSQEALERSFDLGVSKEKRHHLDSLAACIILERYLLESNDGEV